MDLPRDIENIVYSFLHNYELVVFAPQRTKISRIYAFELAAQYDWVVGMNILRQPVLYYALMRAIVNWQACE